MFEPVVAVAGFFGAVHLWFFVDLLMTSGKVSWLRKHHLPSQRAEASALVFKLDPRNVVVLIAFMGFSILYRYICYTSQSIEHDNPILLACC